jgi:hypothetical protein
MAKQKIQTTIIGSINIQSAKGNSKYLKNILNTCDILRIQEHWLLSLEEKMLENMHKDFNLILPTNYPIDFTFHHHNGKGKSQIDYILFKGKTLNLQPSVPIIPFDAINTSDHTLIKVEITTQISKLAPKSAKIYTKPAWDKCNSDEYKKIIQTEIRKQKKHYKTKCCRQNNHTRKYITQGRKEVNTKIQALKDTQICR